MAAAVKYLTPVTLELGGKWWVILNELEIIIYHLYHCVKSFQIGSLSWSVFCRIRTRKNPLFEHFSDSVLVKWSIDNACLFVQKSFLKN